MVSITTREVSKTAPTPFDEARSSLFDDLVDSLHKSSFFQTFCVLSLFETRCCLFCTGSSLPS